MSCSNGVMTCRIVSAVGQVIWESWWQHRCCKFLPFCCRQTLSCRTLYIYAVL